MSPEDDDFENIEVSGIDKLDIKREIRPGELPRRVDNGEFIDAEQVAAMRRLINQDKLRLSPDAEAQLAKHGLTKDDIIASLLKSLGGRQ